MSTMEELFGPVIHSYSRAQEIEDGVLVDVSEAARETGFKWPVAVTAAVWNLVWPSSVLMQEWMRAHGQDMRGRLHDLLWMLFVAIRRGGTGERVDYECIFVVPAEITARAIKGSSRTFQLKALVGPGDDGEPVITVMMPEED